MSLSDLIQDSARQEPDSMEKLLKVIVSGHEPKAADCWLQHLAHSHFETCIDDAALTADEWKELLALRSWEWTATQVRRALFIPGSLVNLRTSQQSCCLAAA